MRLLMKRFYWNEKLKPQLFISTQACPHCVLHSASFWSQDCDDLQGALKEALNSYEQHKSKLFGV